MLFYLMILIMILFTLYHFYIDVKGRLNTGNTFAEGFSGNISPSGGTYYFASESKTFMEHYQAALTMGGNLASIHSAEDNKKVVDVIPGGTGGRIFIGAIRKRPHSNQSAAANMASGKDPRYWAWTDGSEWNYSNWRNGEPNDCCKGQTLNMGEIYGEIGKADGKWNDIFYKYNNNIQKGKAVYKLNVTYPDVKLIEKQTDGGQTWKQQKELCESTGGQLANRREILNFLKDKQAGFDKWIPTRDSENSWLEVGNRKSRGGLTPDYGLFHQDIPDVAYNPNYSADGKPTWGTQGGIQPYRKTVYCSNPNQQNANTVTTTKVSNRVDAATGAKIQEKCVTVSELDNAAAWVDKLFATLGGTKCADKDKVMAAKTASKTDFISGVIKGYENDRDKSNQYYMSAIDKAKPHLEMAFANNNAANEMMTGGQNVQQTNAPVVNNIAAPQQPTWQDQQMAQQYSKQQNGNHIMSNQNVVINGTGQCPNGCSAPVYDSEMCKNEIFNGKEYRRCPWVNDSNTNESCHGCGAILLPKNIHGYARTRPGLFNDITVDRVAKNVAQSNNLDNNADYLKIGTDFMNDLARVKNFTLPNISNNELRRIGKMVYGYELDRNESGKGKLYLTSLINNTLNRDLLPNKDNILTKNRGSARGNTLVDKMDSDDIMSHYYNTQEAASDNRLGGSKTAYKKNYKPVDPRKRPSAYDSIWDVFSK